MDKTQIVPRLPLCAINGVVSYEEVSKLLLIKFAKESVDNAGDGPWGEFLEQLVS